MNKICTSIKQSKELIEIGLDPKTADMCWLSKDYRGVEFFEDPEVKDGHVTVYDLPSGYSKSFLKTVERRNRRIINLLINL